jgi:hypothetical protein
LRVKLQPASSKLATYRFDVEDEERNPAELCDNAVDRLQK